MQWGFGGMAMAIAGGSITAYQCRIVDGAMQVANTTYPRSLCVDPPEAMTKLAAGESVTVAGSDMAKLRTLLAAEGIAQRVSM